MDITKDLFDFLWAHPHREGSGASVESGTDIFNELKISYKEKEK